MKNEIDKSKNILKNNKNKENSILIQKL